MRYLEQIQFAHGGAGFCMSRSLATKMGNLIYKNINNVYMNCMHPDDVLMGAIVHFHGGHFTETQLLHSNYEDMRSIKPESLNDQISFGYKNNNTISINRTVKNDPTGFFSLHCMLFKDSEIC